MKFIAFLALEAFALILGFFLFVNSHALAAPPNGFTTDTLVDSGLNNPTAICFTPDGRLFVVEQGGSIKIYKNNTLLTNQFGSVPAFADSDRGALGITFDPNWNSSPFVYVYFIDKNDGFHKVWKANASGDIISGNWTEIYNSKIVAGSNHAGGGIKFGNDGKLYIGIGDSGLTFKVQDLSSPLGKVLRINSDGTIPTDNPYFGQAGKEQRVWAYGFRNPFRFSFDSVKGNLLLGDVGDSTWEEINLVEKGRNYGWPNSEGKCNTNCSGLTDPIYVYPHTTVNGHNTGAIIGGFVYRGYQFPSQYQGSYFFADFSQAKINSLLLSQSGKSIVGTEIPFDQGVNAIADLLEGPDGNVYYITISPGKLFRISTPQAPVQFGSFQKQLLIPGGLSAPTSLAFSPDGRMFIGEYTGGVRLFKNGVLQQIPLASVSIKDFDGKGLLGLAVDPDWTNSPYIYIYHIGSDGFHKVTRFLINGDSASGSGQEIYNSQLDADHLHFGGGIDFGNDGKLYISIGDGGVPSRAQNLSVPFGKILRINKDGSIPSDNPFFGQSDKGNNIWASGFRNPFRIQFDRLTGRLYVADVGQDLWEEVNIVEKGKNYGWPLAEGKCALNCSGFTDPLFAYPHNGQGASITGGFIYRGDMFPSNLHGSYFFGDYTRKFIKSFSINENQGLLAAGQEVNFDLQSAGVVDLKVGIDGAIYYVYIEGGLVYRISNSSVNRPPTAIFSSSTNQGQPPLTINFSSAGSSDPEGKPLTYLWNFGDGSTSTLANPSYTYTNKGQFTVNLKVSDGVNSSDATPITIKVSTPPTLNITSPLSTYLYTAGDTINFESTAQDSEGNTLPDSAYTTEVRFHHNVHFHPFQPASNIRKGSFLIPNSGEPDSDVWYRIVVTVQDSNGLTTTKQLDIFPKKVNLTVKANIDGIYLNIDGQPKLTPQNFVGVVGAERTLEAPNQTVNGVNYVFQNWSDGGAQQHSIITPQADTVYVANYAPVSVPPLDSYTSEFFLERNLAGTPVLTRNDKEINFVWNGGSPDPKVPNDFFSARFTKKVNLQSGKYKFTQTCDDGCRILVDGKKVVDDWSDHGSRTTSGEVDLQTGEHEIKVEYYEAGGGAVLMANYQRVGDITPVNIPTDYALKFWNFPNAPFTLVPQIPTTPPLAITTSPYIDFTWGNSAPAAGVSPEFFLVEAKAKKLFEDGLYNFETISDDGIRLYIDGEKILDQWNDHGTTTYTATKQMSAGLHEVKVEFYDRTLWARLTLSINKQTGPAGFFANCYNGTSLQGSPIYTANYQDINFVWNGGSPSASVPVDQFSCRFTKLQNYPAGSKTFTVTADDGVRLYIDGELVIDKWKDQGSTTYTATKNLTAGAHEIKIEYYEAFGGAILKYME